jgi:hypothetical protein
MSRAYDHGKQQYAKEHRSSSDQQTRHILANDLLSHYGVNQGNYREWSDGNYRMGSVDTNSRDRRLDNAIASEVFHDVGSGGYNAAALTKATTTKSGRTIAGMSYQQQLDAVGARFEAAKDAYERTGEYKYYMMQKDLRQVAQDHLDGDMRQFRLSSRH